MSRRRKQQPRTRPRGTPSVAAGSGAKPTHAAAERQSQRRPQSSRHRPQSRRRWWPMPGIAIVIALVAGAVVAVVLSIQPPPSTPAANSTLLAPISTSVSGQAVDGIQCQAGEQLLFHIHAHLAVYVNGSARTIPEGIGIMPPRTEESTSAGLAVISGSCFYWLHAHTDDGIIHIESPVQRVYTLGNYFDIWGVPLDNSHVGPVGGTVIAYVNGQRSTGDVRAIPLNAHNLIQLDVNGDVSPAPFTFPTGD